MRTITTTYCPDCSRSTSGACPRHPIKFINVSVYQGDPVTVTPSTFTYPYVCPDLLTLNNLGVADNWRGRVVRACFWVLDRVWPA